jgi:hypothetical protein
MLDVPAYAAVVVGIFFYVNYVRGDRPANLYFSVIAVLAAVYIKLTAVFIVPVLAVTLLIAKGPRILRHGHTIAAAVLVVVGLIPAVLLTLKFGMANIQSVTGRTIDLPRDSIAAWLFYAKTLPQYLGYVGLGLAVCGAAFVAVRRMAPLESWFVWLLAGWFAFGYLFFSAIDVREPRHGMMVAFPLVVFAVLAIHRLLPGRLAPIATATLGLATFLYSLFFYPPPVVTGYGKVADYVALHAPKNAVVLFSGYRDGNFVFDMRTHEERRDISTLRSDKLLLRVAVERERGVGQADLDDKQIADALRDYGVGLIVVQPNFWSDLREMARFSAVLRTPDFERVASFAITGTVAHLDHTIEIYKPTYPVEQTRRALQLDMPIIGETFHGNSGVR